ncbi:phospholipase A2 inhibitor and Ly6/PLAUR domain-containing protein-like [Dendropsophus ebraccatus]|uniref:phospholipase A2 inhibitor and Ly6/PLAUR domain-containing protein-like n=1 Tax=Dendropsophus ebraccatus TaxID=150705 RepID=UPI003831CBBB
MIQSIQTASRALQSSTMVSAVALLCLVAGLLEGAFSLSCYHCDAFGKDCIGNEKQCDKGYDMCIANITEINTVGKPVIKRIVRACGTQAMCNVTYTMSLNGTSLYAMTQCCASKDKCPITDVQKTTTENQVECSTCNEANNEKCKNPVTIKCRGNEKKCMSYTAKDTKTNTKYISQVCATENLCTMQNVTTLPFEQVLMTKFDCTNHAPSMFPGLLFPVAILIAMLKLLS